MAAHITLKTVDGNEIKLAREAALKSEIIRGMLEENSTTDVIPLVHKSCTAHHVRILVDLLSEVPTDLSLPEQDEDTLLHLILVIDHLEITELLRAFAKTKKFLHMAAVKGNLNAVRALIEEKADVEAKDQNGYAAIELTKDEACKEELTRGKLKQMAMTPLMIEVTFGNTKLAQTLLDSNADPNAKDNARNTALHLAVRSGHADIAKALIEGRAIIDVQNLVSEKPLYLAAKFGHAQCVRALVEGKADVSALCMSPYHLWTKEKKDALRFCFENGMDVNANVAVNKEPLIFMAAISGDKDLLQFLAHSGADVNFTRQDGRKPIDFALDGGHEECVDLLVKSKALIDHKKCDSLLARAVAQGHVLITEILIENKADVNAQMLGEDQGMSPIFMAAFGGHQACMHLLIRSKADVNARISDGSSPVIAAVQQGKLECLQMLIEGNADLNLTTKTGANSVLFAAQSCRVDCLQKLIECKADVNVQSEKGVTALHLAAKSMNFKCSKLLIDNGADVCAKTNDGVTALKITLGSYERFKSIEFRDSDDHPLGKCKKEIESIAASLREAGAKD